MQKAFWDNAILPREIAVNVYHDEREVTNKWLYHSFTFIPIENEEDVLDSLSQARQKSGWEKELHFGDLEKTNTENDLALEWIHLFGQSLFEKIYLYFFGVNYRNLERALWENRSQRDFRIYNRFFQIGLYGAIKWFFLTAGFEKVSIENIFSDEKPRKAADGFLTQPIEEIEVKSLSKADDIVFQNSNILEVESNHEKEQHYPEKSHLIQFVDLITGTFGQIFDYTSRSLGKCMSADKCLRFGLPAKLMKYNPNSRYYKKYAISFFPQRKVTKEQILAGDIASKRDQLYNKREMKYAAINQLSLFGHEGSRGLAKK